MSEQTPNRVTRRQALRRIAAAGAVAWAVPAVQTINMTRAFANTQASNPKVCSWFRISRGDLSPGGVTGACGGAISSSDTCLSAVGPIDCSPVLQVPTTPMGSAWTICVGQGYEVSEAALFDTEGHCWRSPQVNADTALGQPVMSDNGTGGWQGWSVSGGCLTAPQSANAYGAYRDIDHIDLMVCAIPGALLTPSPAGTTGPSESPTPSDPKSSATPTPSGATGPSDSPSPSPDGSPTTTPTPGSK